MSKLSFFLFLAVVSIKQVGAVTESQNVSSSLAASINDEACPPGRYALNDTYIAQKIICIPCDEDSYKSEQGNMECTPCPDGSNTNKTGSTDPSDCMCSPGRFRQEMYNGEPSANISCSRCPSGGDCDGYRNEIIPRPGYWLDIIPVGANGTRFEILDCFGYQRCLGTTDNACEEGWGGNLCSLCAYDDEEKDAGRYFSFFGTCKPCYSTVVNVLLHLAVYLSWILLNICVAEQYTVIALLIDWMQLMSIIGYINTGWPESVSWFLNIARFFSFDLDVVSWQCISSWNFFWEMLLQFAVPFALSLFWVALLCPVILFKFTDRRKKIFKKTDHRQVDRSTEFVRKNLYTPSREFLGAIGFLDYFHEKINWNFLKAKVMVSFESTYVISTFYALSSLSYRIINGVKVIFNAPYYEASTESTVLGILGLLFLSIGFPCFMLFRWIRFQPKGDGDPGKFSDSSIRQAYQWFYARFRIGKWHLALFGFLHRFTQICAVVFIRDAGMALNVSFVLNLLFGLFVGLQHPNESLKINAIEYITMFSTVATLLCGMWFNWINVSTDYSINTSRALNEEAWGGVWLNNLVEICALVNLGLTCLVFFYCVLLEFIDIRCLSESRSRLKNLFNGMKSSKRGDEHWSSEAFQNNDILVRYLQPIALRSWVGKIKVECISEEERVQLITDFGYTCHALSKFANENPRHDPYSLSKDAVLWRKFFSHYPGILSMLLYGSEDLKKSFITFFKEFYSLYWEPSRRSMTRFLTMFSWIHRLTDYIRCEEIDHTRTEEQRNLETFQDLSQYNETIDGFFADCNGLCDSCKEKCRQILDDYHPKFLYIREQEEGKSNGLTYPALCSLCGLCRGIAASCTLSACSEQKAIDYMQEEMNKRNNHEVPVGILTEPPSAWEKCPPDISGLFTRRYRATVGYWLASLSQAEDIDQNYTRHRVERLRFIRLAESFLKNKHQSWLEKFARLITLQSLSPFSRINGKEGKLLEDVLPAFDVNAPSSELKQRFCQLGRRHLDSAGDYE